jgi:two-component system heavy metal sensor histidine kinase CusS
MTRKFALTLNSLTFRLSLLFAISAMTLLASTGTFLYQFLENELMKRDHQELISKIEIFRNHLSTLSSPEDLTSDPNYFRDFIISHPHFRLALMDAQGNILLSSGDWHPPAILLKKYIAQDPNPLTMQMPTEERPYHAISGWTAVGRNIKNTVFIILALDVDEAQNLLSGYKQKLWLTLFFSVSAAVALAFIIARGGLLPLQTMAETARKISASKLQTRLNVERAPAELKELAGAFNDMLGRLHHSFARLSEFSSDIAHELRTPINNLMGQTQVALSKSRNADEYRIVLESNLEEYERLARMIRDMLFLAQSDNLQSGSNAPPLQTELIDLKVELDKITEYYQMLADENKVKITSSGSGTLNADRILLQRAIGNLILNAVQHSPANSEVTATATTLDDEVQLSIQNQGEGIPPEKLDRVFDRFYRINNNQKRNESGSGLGLAIVKSIMELHGGYISVESIENQQTNFTLHFPGHSKK